jgi:hypothetical protein
MNYFLSSVIFACLASRALLVDNAGRHHHVQVTSHGYHRVCVHLP